MKRLPLRRVVQGLSLAAAAVAALSGCWWGGSSGEKASEEDIQRLIREAAQGAGRNPPSDRSRGLSGLVQLRALADRAEVRVSLNNGTNRTIVVGPKNFAVIPWRSSQLVLASPDSPRFPVAKVAPGGEIAGVLRFPGVALLRGGKLVFNHPDCSPVAVLID